MSEWKTIKLGELYDFKNGVNFNKNQKGDKGILTIDVLNMYSDNHYVDLDNLYRVDKNFSDSYFLKKGDILFVRSSVKREGVGWVSLFLGASEPVVFCGFIIRARPIKSKMVDSDFLIYLLRSRKYREIIINRSKQSTITNISQDNLFDITIDLPPIEEQKRIVEILDKAFEGIAQAEANARRNLINAQELFDSYLNNIFRERGDEWIDEKLGDISENLDSERIPVTKSKRTSGKVPYYGASGIVDYVDDFIFDEELLLVSEDGANLLARTYPIAFSISGKAWVNNHAHVLKFNDISLQRFIEYFLNSISLERYVSGMAQPKLNQKALNSILIPIAPKEIREKVVNNLDSLKGNVNSLETIYQRKLEAIAELKQSILEKAFTGQLSQ
ncbi:restriction endonuclease subunit S [Microcystis aeruginosa]|uniref:restriction endonuclease subunit S n=1 Tax=Microcystis aeruginosa TaxID=1126 RepID=UPI00232E49EA|nr:restriction endonuclease subunit S [Microcystis aeruginosa]MDB9433828.1 restriction endonuclease subunit S [Microcystis aeruginosa CS-552/01]